MTGHGGWPMTVFLTPTASRSTPARTSRRRPATACRRSPSCSPRSPQTWAERRERGAGGAASASPSALAERGAAAPARATPPTPDAPRRGRAPRWRRQFDRARGGFGGAPKFPPSMVLEFLLRHHARTGDADGARAWSSGTCEAMARGGMYDQLGGGFARYSVDADWVVPHFEKMLYDNALLLRVVPALVARDRLGRSAGGSSRETARLPARATCAPPRAASPPRSTPTPTASRADVRLDAASSSSTCSAPTTARGPPTCSRSPPAGTFEHGTSTLQLRRDPDDADAAGPASARRCSPRARRAPSRPATTRSWPRGTGSRSPRSPRPAPCSTGRTGSRPPCVRPTCSLAVAPRCRTGPAAPGLARRRRRARTRGVLEDHADVAEGFLALYAVDRRRGVARPSPASLLDVVLDHFRDGDGGFFDTADDAERAASRRPQDPTDNATPSGLVGRGGRPAHLRRAHRVEPAPRGGRGGARRLRAAGRRAPAVRRLGAGRRRGAARRSARGRGRRAGAATRRTRCAARASPWRATAPGAVVAVGRPGRAPSASRCCATGRWSADAPAAYVCRHFVCDAPVTDPPRLAAAARQREDLTDAARRLDRRASSRRRAAGPTTAVARSTTSDRPARLRADGSGRVVERRRTGEVAGRLRLPGGGRTRVPRQDESPRRADVERRAAAGPGRSALGTASPGGARPRPRGAAAAGCARSCQAGTRAACGCCPAGLRADAGRTTSARSTYADCPVRAVSRTADRAGPTLLVIV